MPYTNVWSDIAPPGSQNANTVDDELRKLRLDIHERLSGALVGPITDDPLVVKPEILGNVVGKRYMIHHSAFKPDVEWDVVSAQPTFTRVALYAEHLNTDASTRSMWAPLYIPPGVTITGIEFLVNRNGGSNMTVKFGKIDFTVTPASDFGSSTSTAANGIVLLSLAPAYLVLNTQMLALEVTFPGGQAARLYGAKVIYSTPDCRNTV